MYSFFFSSRRRHTRWPRDWSSDVCSSDLTEYIEGSLTIEKYPATLNGTPTGNPETVTGVTPEVNGQEFSIPLSDINDVYVNKYKTKVTDLDGKHFNNEETLTDHELKDTSDYAPVPMNCGSQIKQV